MKWIILIIIAFIAWIFFRFLFDSIKQRAKLKSLGGVRSIYKILIDGLLQYPSAEIKQDFPTLVTICGTFWDPIWSRTCGKWAITIQQTFKILNVSYEAYNNLEGGEHTKQMWDFPIGMDQHKMLSIIQKKADEWDVYGICK